MVSWYNYKSIWISLIWWSVWRSSQSIWECGWSPNNKDQQSSRSRGSTIRRLFTNHRFTSMVACLNSRPRSTLASSARFIDTTYLARGGRGASLTSWTITPSATSTRIPPSSSITWCTSSAAKTTRMVPMSSGSGASIWSLSIGRDRSSRGTRPRPEKMPLWYCINAVWSCFTVGDMKATIWTICTYTELRIRFGYKSRKQTTTSKLAVDSNPHSPHREIFSIFSEERGW